MFKKTLSALLLCMIISCTAKKTDQLPLSKQIQQKFEAAEGTFAMAFVSLEPNQSEQKILINAQKMFHAASTMKTPVMIELFKQAEAGTFDLSDSILVKNKFHSIVDSSIYKLDKKSDSYAQLYKQIGQKKTIRRLMEIMITHSSNLATNILVGLVGPKNVTQTMRSYGADDILVLRGVGDLKAFRKGLSDSTNAHDQMIIYTKLGRGQLVSDSASKKMVDILSHQQFNTMIPAGLPDSVTVAHKTGWITGVNHDCALVILPDGQKYVLILLSKKAPNREKVHQMFANISHMVYKYVINNTKTHP